MRPTSVPTSLPAAAMLFALTSAACAQQPGRIVVSNDEWTITSYGCTEPGDGAVFAANVASWFNHGEIGVFGVWDHYAFNNQPFVDAMTGQGHLLGLLPATITLPVLQQYDGVFLTAATFPTQLLIDYVEGGGNVYVAAGTGAWFWPDLEADAWNPFLEHFGLKLHNEFNTSGGTHMPVSEWHPLFAGVDHLWHDVGQGIFDLVPSNPANRVFVPVPGYPEQGHYAAYDGSVCYADCNDHGGLTVSDFVCFQTKFVSGEPYADCNTSGGLSVADFACFQAKFVAGCP